MHVLVTESRFGAAGRIVERLRAAGVRVSTCHDRVGFCRALGPGRRCPLDDRTDPIDLVVDVRGAGEELTARELGAVCAVRAMLGVFIVPQDPSMVAVVPAGLRSFAGGVTEDELIQACRRAEQTRAAARAGWAGRPVRAG